MFPVRAFPNRMFTGCYFAHCGGGVPEIIDVVGSSQMIVNVSGSQETNVLFAGSQQTVIDAAGSWETD